MLGSGVIRGGGNPLPNYGGEGVPRRSFFVQERSINYLSAIPVSLASLPNTTVSASVWPPPARSRKWNRLLGCAVLVDEDFLIHAGYTAGRILGQDAILGVAKGKKPNLIHLAEGGAGRDGHVDAVAPRAGTAVGGLYLGKTGSRPLVGSIALGNHLAIGRQAARGKDNAPGSGKGVGVIVKMRT